MITPEHARVMAAYNRWQNDSLYAAADTISDAARRQDRGAFFGSIHATFNHLLAVDLMWLSRFGVDIDVPDFTRETAATLYEKWDDLHRNRINCDEAITAWAHALTAADLTGTLTWVSVS